MSLSARRAFQKCVKMCELVSTDAWMKLREKRNSSGVECQDWCLVTRHSAVGVKSACRGARVKRDSQGSWGQVF